jgi:hypothetical protein
MKHDILLNEHRPSSALKPLSAKPPIDATPKALIHCLVKSPNLNAVDLMPTLRSSSLSCHEYDHKKQYFAQIGYERTPLLKYLMCIYGIVHQRPAYTSSIQWKDDCRV